MNKSKTLQDIEKRICHQSWKKLSEEANLKNCLLLKSGQELAEIAFLLINDEKELFQTLLVEEEIIGIKKKLMEEWNKMKNLEFDFIEISPYLLLKKRKIEEEPTQEEDENEA